jgi:hypothetical protein
MTPSLDFNQLKGGDCVMVRNRTTSLRAARAASKVLRDRRTSKASKTRGRQRFEPATLQAKGEVTTNLDARVDLLAAQYYSFGAATG